MYRARLTCVSSPMAASTRSSSAGRATASPLRRAPHRATDGTLGRMTSIYCEDPDGNLVRGRHLLGRPLMIECGALSGTQAVFGSRPVLGTDKSRSPAEDTIATPRGVASNIHHRSHQRHRRPRHRRATAMPTPTSRFRKACWRPQRAIYSTWSQAARLWRFPR